MSTVNQCQLKQVLDFLSVDNTSPCKYDGIKNDSTDIRNWGISLLVLSSIMFLLIFNYKWILENNIIRIRYAVSTQWIFMVIYLCVFFFKSRNPNVMFQLLYILFSQFVGIVVVGCLAIMYAVRMILFYREILDFKETQTDTVCIISYLQYI